MQIDSDCFTYRNEQASRDLIIPIELVECVDREAMTANLEKNIGFDAPWLTPSPEHDGVAVICGAAPSLNTSFDDIQGLGGVVFACNSAAKVLFENGVSVDYQAMLEPHEIIVEKFCDDAKAHLLGSIVPPELFQRSKRPILWHPLVDFIQEALEDCPKEFSYIGGGISIGIYSLCIAYTMGFREIHVFGMDSSFGGEEFYANGDGLGIGYLLVEVEHDGKTYPTTYDMKQQVLAFLKFKNLLAAAGCRVFVHGEGLLHAVVNQ